MNLRQDIRLLALINLFLGIFMAVPTIIAGANDENAALWAFYLSMALDLVVSAVAIAVSRGHEDRHMAPADCFFFVTFTWISATAFGALPLYWSGVYPTYADAYFEIMSGFTTTGATVVTTMKDVPYSIRLWRSMTNWLGGMGIVVLFVAVLPLLGIRGTMLYGAEAPGPTKDKLTPKIGGTAGTLWLIYVVITLILIFLLRIEGLPVFDAVCVAFSTISSAGFAPRDGSIAAYGSPSVEITVTVFMIIAGINFGLFYALFNGRPREFLKNPELRLYIGIICVSAIAIAIDLVATRTVARVSTALRQSFFSVASIITTTGFATTDFGLWPWFAQLVLFSLFFVGGCSGSTGGGPKVIRVQAAFVLARNSIRKRLHPSSVVKNKIGDSVIDDDEMLDISGFLGLYFGVGMAGTILLTLSGVDLTTAITSSFLCLGNIGAGLGEVSPSGNFAFYPSWAKWLLSFLMLAGRLELFTVFSLLSPTLRTDLANQWASVRERSRVRKLRLKIISERAEREKARAEQEQDSLPSSPSPAPANPPVPSAPKPDQKGEEAKPAQLELFPSAPPAEGAGSGEQKPAEAPASAPEEIPEAGAASGSASSEESGNGAAAASPEKAEKQPERSKKATRSRVKAQSPQQGGETPSSLPPRRRRTRRNIKEK